MTVKANFLKKGKLGEKVRRGEVWKNVKTAWESIMESTSEEEYNSSLNTFKERCGQWAKIVQYVKATVPGPVKEKFVMVWTNEVMHLGNTTTNRVKSSHAQLKKHLMNSLGDITKNWERIDNMLTNMFIELC
jgi:alpha-glucosidase